MREARRVGDVPRRGAHDVAGVRRVSDGIEVVPRRMAGDGGVCGGQTTADEEHTRRVAGSRGGGRSNAPPTKHTTRVPPRAKNRRVVGDYITALGFKLRINSKMLLMQCYYYYAFPTSRRVSIADYAEAPA